MTLRSSWRVSRMADLANLLMNWKDADDGSDQEATAYSEILNTMGAIIDGESAWRRKEREELSPDSSLPAEEVKRSEPIVEVALPRTPMGAAFNFDEWLLGVLRTKKSLSAQVDDLQRHCTRLEGERREQAARALVAEDENRSLTTKLVALTVKGRA